MTDTSSQVDLSLVGEGDMPPEFDRVNWGAYIVPPFWAAFYGLRRVVLAYVVYIVGGFVVLGAVAAFASGSTFERVSTVSNDLGFPLLVLAAVVLGLKANRYVWRVQQSLFATPAGPKSPIPVWRLRKSNRFWFRVATVFVVLDVIALGWSLVTDPAGLVEGWRSSLGAIVLLSLYGYDLWLARRSRSAS